MGVTSKQAIEGQWHKHLGDYAKERNPGARWQVIRLMYAGYTTEQALAEVGGSWGGLGYWKSADREWAEEYAKAQDTLADRYADKSVTVLDDLHTELRELPADKIKLGNALASAARDRSNRLAWRASVQAPKRWSEKTQTDMGQAVNVVVMLPDLQGLPPASARVLPDNTTDAIAEVVDSKQLTSGEFA